jgi:hypothetical protein
MKKIFLIITTVILSISLNAQNATNLFTPEQEFVFKATDSALVIIRIDYRLKDTNNLSYGLGGKTYFGRSYALGILSDNRVYMDEKALNPWLTDTNYVEYKNNKLYEPYLIPILFRRVCDQSFSDTLFINYKNDSLESGFKGFSLTNFNKGIQQIKECKDSSGWLILAYTTEEFMKNDSLDLKWIIYRPGLKIAENKLDAEVKKMQNEKNLIGGIYINTNLSMGNVSFQFSGILIKKIFKWYVLTLEKEKLMLPKIDKTLTPMIEGVKVNEKDKKETKKEKKK